MFDKFPVTHSSSRSDAFHVLAPREDAYMIEGVLWFKPVPSSAHVQVQQPVPALSDRELHAEDVLPEAAALIQSSFERFYFYYSFPFL
jgi:hypothetical protein